MSAAAPVEGAAAMQGVATGSSFFWAMRLLPAARREGMFAVYAFCREVDDIADGEAPHGERLAGLADWRAEIDALYAGTPRHPVARALLRPTETFGLRRGDFLGVIEGMEMDAREDIRGPTMDVLDRYCDRVASAVGRLSVRVFGLDDGQGLPLAHHLGRALQLTNILRDVAEDADRGRLYLPGELLARHGVPSRDPQEVVRAAGLPAVCRELAKVADRHFGEAERVIRVAPRPAVRPAAVMAAVYRRLLARLVAADWRDPTRPVRVPGATKLWIAVRHGLL